MQPTVDAELAAVRRVLDGLAAQPSLPAEATEALREASRILQRLEKTWSKVLPYLVFDSAGVISLLREVASALPAALQGEIAELAFPEGVLTAASVPDVTAVNELDEQARALLSRAIAVLPPGSPAASGPRARINAFLVESLERRPW